MVLRFFLFASAFLFVYSCTDVERDDPDDPKSKYYRTVVIGTQTWMAKNLNCNVSGSKCYSNSEANCDIYGRLYDWATAMNLPSSCNSSTCASQVGAKHQGICPSGWHIPSDAEWNVLMKYVNPSCSDNSICEGAGGKLKANSPLWEENGKGTDNFGFAALPGGSGNSDGSFDNVGYFGYWWSASENDAGNAYRLDYGNETVGRSRYYKGDILFSVRCLQD